MKQYFVKKAYTDNCHVIQCVDGVISDRIIAYHQLQGYTSALEDMGYTKAYYLPEYEKKMLEAKEEYERAKAEYEEALTNPLIVSKEEADQYYFLKVERQEVYD